MADVEKEVAKDAEDEEQAQAAEAKKAETPDQTEGDEASEGKSAEQESDGIKQEAAEDGAEADQEEDTEPDEGAEEPVCEDAGNGKESKASWAERMAAKKQAKQEKKLDPLKERIAELEDRTKRQLAEFENFRKRSEKEKQAMFEVGAKSVIEKILPVIDNFERGLATVPEDKKDDAFVDGMNKVYRQMLTELDNIGVKPIEAVGREFDPKFHNAVMQVASEEYEAGTVAQELQKGYTYRDSVVRHSMVAVVSE